MKTFLILGAGTGGTMMANKLVKRLDPKEWKIILVDKDETHYYQPGFLFLPFEYYKPEEVYQPKKKFVPSGVEFILSDVELIEPEANKVTLAKDKKVIHYDQLLIATGTDIHPEEVDGMLDGWRQNIFDYFTFDGAMALREFLKNFKGGRVVLNIKEMPIKCPVAPLEFVYLADYFFTQKGMRNKVDLIFTTPLSGPFTKPVSNKLLGDVMTKKGIHTEAEFDVMEVDAAKNIIRGYDGRELEYDLLVSIPTNMGSDVIKRSGMGDDLYFVPTNKDTLRSEKYENIWVIGDAANIPASKAGSVVHYAAETLIENILDALEGRPLSHKYDGHSTCHILSGFNKSLLIDFSYDTEPLTGLYPFPVIGPFPLLKESWFNYIGKLSFKWIYWNIMLRGIPFPLPPEYSIAGKKQVAVS
ncbi:MAG TPA: FAD/NAD(P)-binding oxidoreductase [Anaerolineaceae bacterium]|jgi:sulfide:quinone oxidoreductase|nr:NAD(P)/FAD-dependent oxidoreductase [Chloroflexota bacterium]HNS06393.1 FAD/NAD(P)-binding oxidoreductase [Anaerolineaceae bacterium]HNW14442.1 FAD/NAD(P)-binding oxidoreductase [Anaerolineaceae bacterium]HOE03257.1 FAD/NAD(P)-binding oxidoreductase [Anaerolineaceae bacterium]HOQ70101.1 FAD/NAD(P)-binding oxidoreductase [Anaerolineaceae bacterium]